MSEIDGLIEKNANLVKWCVHVYGPDDVHATATHKDAVDLAEKWNRETFGVPDAADLSSIMCFAFAAPWPHSDDAHTDDLIARNAGA